VEFRTSHGSFGAMKQPPLFAALHHHRIPVEPLLQRVLERVEADPQFRRDLDLAGFQPWPSPADEIDCLNPWLFVIAMNGGGNAFGLYVHPTAVRDGVAPWVEWEHEDDSLRFWARDTDAFFRALLANLFELEEVRLRLHVLFIEMGMSSAPAPAEGAPAWLPPRHEGLRPVEHFLSLLAADPAEAERGLLTHAMDQDPRAREALELLNARRGWLPPRSL
jgi:hypothetical protein